MPITITLRQILDAGPCYDPREGRPALLPADWPIDASISAMEIIERVPFEDALWCLRCWPERASLWRHYAVDCAERVKHLLKDSWSLTALDVARRHADGTATDDELAATWDAAWDAVRDAASAAAWDAVRAAAWDAAWDAARTAARATAWAAARAAAWDAVRAAASVTVRAATWDAVRDATWVAERAWQKARLIELTEAGEWSPVKPFG